MSSKTKVILFYVMTVRRLLSKSLVRRRKTFLFFLRGGGVLENMLYILYAGLCRPWLGLVPD